MTKNRIAKKHDETRRRTAAVRKHSAEEQLARLDQRLGKGVGAAKERERLQNKLSS